MQLRINGIALMILALSLYSCFNSGKRVFVLIDSNSNIEKNCMVLMEGKEIGVLKKVEQLEGEKQLLELLIEPEIQINKQSLVHYGINILGSCYIEFLDEGNKDLPDYMNLKRGDTLRGVVIRDTSILMDSAEKARIFRTLKNIKDSLDTLIK